MSGRRAAISGLALFDVLVWYPLARRHLGTGCIAIGLAAGPFVGRLLTTLMMTVLVSAFPRDDPMEMRPSYAVPLRVFAALGWLVLGPVLAASVYTSYRDIYLKAR